jgi:integrase
MGYPIEKRQKWYVSNDLIGSKFDTQYMLDNLKNGFDKKLNELPSITKKIDKIKSIQLIASTCVLALTGCRVSEALLLTFKDIKMEKDEDGTRWITFYLSNLKSRKNNKKKKQIIKKIPHQIRKDSKYYFLFKSFDLLYEIVLSEIEKGLKNNQLKEKDVFEFPLFSLINRFHVYEFTTQYCDINPHGLRKLYAQELVVNQNLPIKVVQKLLGHRSLETLEFYINLRTEDIKKNLKKI